MNYRFDNATTVKFIAKQPPKQQQRIMAAIEALPRGDTKFLQGTNGVCRLRVGDYRVVYTIDWIDKVIVVHNIGNRGDVYKG